MLRLSGCLCHFLTHTLTHPPAPPPSQVTASVANTAKRVIVMLVSAVVFGEELTFEKKIGSAVAIAGVFLYSVVDDLLKKTTDKPKKK